MQRSRLGALVVSGIGILSVVLAAVRAFIVVSRGARVPGQLLNVALVALPSLVLVYGGVFRLRRSDIHEAVQPRIAGWSLLGGGLMVGIIVVVELTPGGGVENIGLALVLFGALGSVGGLGIGLNEAHAITRARDLERRNEQVERYSQQLQRQNARLESFGGMLAHELRNPLNVAQLYVQRIEGDDEAVEQVEEALDRIEEMIDVLLITARGRDATVDPEAVSLAEVATDVWEDLDPTAADLVLDIGRTVQADPIHLRHLFENLFSNAIEHGRSDVTIRVGDLEDASPSEASGDSTDGSVGGFYVEDDGPGIPPEERENVFDAGYTTASNGTGLGLTFVAQLAEAYGWEYRVTESDDGGARFEFTGIGQTTPSERQLP